MERRFADIEHEGITFTIEGEWEDAIKSNFAEQNQDSGFYEYDILIDDVSIHKMLTEDVCALLVSQAEERLRGIE